MCIEPTYILFTWAGGMHTHYVYSYSSCMLLYMVYAYSICAHTHAHTHILIISKQLFPSASMTLKWVFEPKLMDITLLRVYSRIFQIHTRFFFFPLYNTLNQSSALLLALLPHFCLLYHVVFPDTLMINALT